MLSIISGYNVPCARYSTFFIFFASFSNTLIKVFPIIFLFFSGSFIFFNFDIKILEASTLIKFLPNFFLNIDTTSFDSLNLNNP